MDTVIQLRHPEDYNPADGARFEVHLTKARGIFGEDAAPFEAKLNMQDDGSAVWTCLDLGTDDELAEEVLALHAQGKSVREIAREVGKSKSAVGRIVKGVKPPTGLQSELAPSEADQLPN